MDMRRMGNRADGSFGDADRVTGSGFVSLMPLA
jgi:hypothetical protein